MEREEILRRLGERLRELRTAKGLSQEELAQVATVDRGYISETETGDRNPSVWVIYRLAEALGVKPGILLPDYDDQRAGTAAQSGFRVIPGVYIYHRQGN